MQKQGGCCTGDRDGVRSSPSASLEVNTTTPHPHPDSRRHGMKVILEEQMSPGRRWKSLMVPDDTVASVGRKDDDGGDGRLQRPVQVGEALDIQHVDLINEQHARNQLRHALVDVLVHHLVNLPSEFI